MSEQIAKYAGPLDLTRPEFDERLRSEFDLPKIDQIVQRCTPEALAKKSAFEQVVILGLAMTQLRELIAGSAMIDGLMSLQNSQLGFTTDLANSKGDGPKFYAKEVVCDVFIEATLKGVRPINNEFTIISSRLYIGKNGVKRLVRDFPGLTNLNYSFGVPRGSGTDAGAVVECSATWKLNGTDMSIQCNIPVRNNAGMGVDALLGKAERKLFARIYNQLTGSERVTENDDDAGGGGEVRAVNGRLEAMRAADAVAPISATTSRQAFTENTRETKPRDPEKGAGTAGPDAPSQSAAVAPTPAAPSDTAPAGPAEKSAPAERTSGRPAAKREEAPAVAAEDIDLAAKKFSDEIPSVSKGRDWLLKIDAKHRAAATKACGVQSVADVADLDQMRGLVRLARLSQLGKV